MFHSCHSTAFTAEANLWCVSQKGILRTTDTNLTHNKTLKKQSSSDLKWPQSQSCFSLWAGSSTEYEPKRPTVQGIFFSQRPFLSDTPMCRNSNATLSRGHWGKEHCTIANSRSYFLNKKNLKSCTNFPYFRDNLLLLAIKQIALWSKDCEPLKKYMG